MKKLLNIGIVLTLGFIFFIPKVSHAAIALDATSTGSVSASTSLTYSQTTTGSNITVVVYVYAKNSANDYTVTYNGGANFTKVDSVLDANNFTNAEYVQYIGNGVGAKNIIITGTSADIRSMTWSFTGTNATQNGAHKSDSEASPFPALTITTTQNNSVMVAGYWVNGDSTTTTGKNGSLVDVVRINGSASTQSMGGHLSTPTAGSNTIDWNNQADIRAGVVVEIVPPATVTATPLGNTFTLFGDW